MNLDETNTIHTSNGPLIVELGSEFHIVDGPFLKKSVKLNTAGLTALLSVIAPTPSLHEVGSSTVSKLVAADLIHVDKARAQELNVRPGPWCEWGALAWAWHERCRRQQFGDPPDLIEKLSQNGPLGSLPAESPDLPWPPTGQATSLPPVLNDLSTVPASDVLFGRRTVRHFSGEAIDISLLSDFLRYSFGPVHFSDAGVYGTVELRAAVGGGARHVTRAYVWCANVAGLDRGLYAYDQVNHTLVKLDGRQFDEDDLRYLSYGQTMFDSTAAVCFIVSRTSRYYRKYRSPRAYRTMLNDIGATVQVCSMVAWGLGVAASLNGAFRDEEIEKRLGCTQPDYFMSFMVGLGVPILNSNGTPLDFSEALAPSYRHVNE